MTGFLAQALLMLFIAPLSIGVTKKVKARCQRRTGPPLLQLYYDLAKWLRKECVLSDLASPLFRFYPSLVLGLLTLAAALAPTVTPCAGVGDIFLIVGLMGLARFLLALAGLEAGSSFGGMSASRDTALSALVEPGLILALVTAALAAGRTSAGAIALALQSGPPISALAGLLLSGAALYILTLTETGRLPFDNPDTHLELTMVHEGMILEYSGRHLAAVHLASAVRQVLLLSLLAAFFLPWGLATAPCTVFSLALGAGAWLAKMLLLSSLLGVTESLSVKVRFFRAPELLGGAFLLAFFGAYLIGGRFF